MKKYDKENMKLFSNWDWIMLNRNEYLRRQRKVKLKKRIKSKRKRKLWYKENCS